MEPPRTSDAASAYPDDLAARLRLYIARSTPNSVRAEHHLSMVIADFGDAFEKASLEVIDVFTQPKRAFVDGVVVTPTLIGVNARKRVVLMGDLADLVHLQLVLQDLLAIASAAPPPSGDDLMG